MAHPPQVKSSKLIYSGRSFSVKEEQLLLHSGKTVTRGIVEHHGAVVIVPQTSNGSLLLVRQYRHASGKSLLEFPAGTIEKGEETLLCAKRELEEETQHRAEKWHPVGGFYSAPGFCSEFLWCFVATELSPATAAQDEDEDCEVVAMTLTEVQRAILDQEIVDAKTIAALSLAQLHHIL